MNSRITDMIRSNGERLNVLRFAMLKRCLYVFVTVSVTYVLRFKVGFGGFKTVFDDFGDPMK